MNAYQLTLSLALAATLAACGGGGGSSSSSASGSSVDYTTSFSMKQVGKSTLSLTQTQSRHLDMTQSFTLAQTTTAWAYVAAQRPAKVYLLDQFNASAFQNNLPYQGVLLNAQGANVVGTVTLAAGTYWIGTEAAETALDPAYANTVYRSVTYDDGLPKWTPDRNLPLIASGIAGSWTAKDFTTGTGDFRAHLETGGSAGKFVLMTPTQYSNFSFTYASGYTGGAYEYISNACKSGATTPGTNLSCELNLLPSTKYYLVHFNDSNNWAGATGNVRFYRPN